MAKTIVNIVTDDDPISAYLFLREMYAEGDRLMYISARSTVEDMHHLIGVDLVADEMTETIALERNIDEMAYERICRTILPHLNHETHYCVNLAGGTRYMALAVQQVFEQFGSDFYYVHVEQNKIVHSIYDNSIYDNDDNTVKINYRLTVGEYLSIHGIENNLNKKNHQPIRLAEDANRMFGIFIQQKDGALYRTLDLLREHYRGRNHVDIAEAENSGKGNAPAIKGLSAVLKRIGFTPSSDGELNKAETEYLTGGWFEEWVYYQIVNNVVPDDAAIGVVIRRHDATANNELDVVFTKSNKLFVVECKTGVETMQMFNQIVYKACAIREALLGVSCYSYIFSLRKDDDKDTLARMARNMDTRFVGYEELTTDGVLRNELTLMKQKAR